jgi:hypothetical protein
MIDDLFIDVAIEDWIIASSCVHRFIESAHVYRRAITRFIDPMTQ